MSDDAELLRRYVAGSEPAFAALVERHLTLVHSAALRRLGNDPHAAADVAQQVFIALARKAPALMGQQVVLPSWLYATTRNIAVDFVRAEQSRRRRERDAHAMHEVNGGEPSPEWEHVRPLLDAAIDELAEADREAVVLRYFARQPFGRIATTLGTGEDAARMRVTRALDKLYAALAARGVTSSTTALAAVLTQHAAVATPFGLAPVITQSALAATPSAVAVTASASLMAAKKIGVAVAVVAVVCSIGIAVFETRRAKAAEASLSVERREIQALSLRTAEAERRAKEATQSAAARPGAEKAAAKKAEPEEEVRGPFGRAPAGSRARGRALMAAYPEIQRLVIAEKRAFFSAYYQKLYRELGLTEAQIEAFELVRIAGVSTTSGAGEETVTLDAMPPLPAEEKERRYREILGERGYARLQEFEQSPRSSQPAKLASVLYYSDTPLTADQAARFERVLTESSSAMNQSPATYWAAVRQKAAEFLSPPQLEAMDLLQASDEYTFARIQNQKLREQAAVPTTN